MFAGGELRNDAAIFSMKSRLGRDDVGKDVAVADESRAGFVARAFDRQNRHQSKSLNPAVRARIGQLKARSGGEGVATIFERAGDFGHLVGGGWDFVFEFDGALDGP